MHGGVELQLGGIPRNMFSVYSTILVEGVEVSVEKTEFKEKKRKCRT
jgi:hypothetical protein